MPETELRNGLLLDGEYLADFVHAVVGRDSGPFHTRLEATYTDDEPDHTRRTMLSRLDHYVVSACAG